MLSFQKAIAINVHSCVQLHVALEFLFSIKLDTSLNLLNFIAMIPIYTLIILEQRPKNFLEGVETIYLLSFVDWGYVKRQNVTLTNHY